MPTGTSDELEQKREEWLEAFARVNDYVPLSRYDDTTKLAERACSEMFGRIASLEARLRVAGEALTDALQLADDLIGYSGLREKVRLRDDPTEYEDAERLVARADAIHARFATASGEGEEEAGVAQTPALIREPSAQEACGEQKSGDSVTRRSRLGTPTPASSSLAEPPGVVLSEQYDLARGAFAAGWAETEGELDRDAAFSRWWSALLDRKGADG